MKRFDSKGMLSIPDSSREGSICKTQSSKQVKECYCQHGHNLVSNKTDFNGLNGILLKIKNRHQSGLVALSPLFSDKSRISQDIELVKNDIWDICCPHCDVALPVYSNCSCGGNIIALFSAPNADFANCIGICNRVGCFNSNIQNSYDLVTKKTLEFVPLWFNGEMFVNNLRPAS